MILTNITPISKMTKEAKYTVSKSIDKGTLTIKYYVDGSIEFIWNTNGRDYRKTFERWGCSVCFDSDEVLLDLSTGLTKKLSISSDQILQLYMILGGKWCLLGAYPMEKISNESHVPTLNESSVLDESETPTSSPVLPDPLLEIKAINDRLIRKIKKQQLRIDKLAEKQDGRIACMGAIMFFVCAALCFGFTCSVQLNTNQVQAIQNLPSNLLETAQHLRKINEKISAIEERSVWNATKSATDLTQLIMINQGPLFATTFLLLLLTMVIKEINRAWSKKSVEINDIQTRLRTIPQQETVVKSLVPQPEPCILPRNRLFIRKYQRTLANRR